MDISLRLGPGSLATMGGGGGGGFTPLDLGASLIAWWTADRSDLITLSGAQVSGWKDVVAGYDAAQVVAGSRPTYSSTSFGGAPGLTFDGIDDELTSVTSAMLAALPDGAEAGEIWSIVQQDALPADSSQRNITSYGNGPNVSRFQRRAVPAGSNAARTKVAAINNDASDDFSSRHVVRSIISATNIRTQVDGGTISVSTSVIPATATERLRLGATSENSPGLFWQGLERDVLFTAPLNTEQADLLNAWALPRRML